MGAATGLKIKDMLKEGAWQQRPASIIARGAAKGGEGRGGGSGGKI